MKSILGRLRRSAMVCLAAIALISAGCGAQPQIGPPPIEFSFRKAQVPTKGVVAGLRNSSTQETLSGLVVYVRSPLQNNVRSYRVDVDVEPQDSITVGWIELDGFKLQPGDEIWASCRQYQGSAQATVPKP